MIIDTQGTIWSGSDEEEGNEFSWVNKVELEDEDFEVVKMVEENLNYYEEKGKLNPSVGRIMKVEIKEELCEKLKSYVYYSGTNKYDPLSKINKLFYNDWSKQGSNNRKTLRESDTVYFDWRGCSSKESKKNKIKREWENNEFTTFAELFNAIKERVNDTLNNAFNKDNKELKRIIVNTYYKRVNPDNVEEDLEGWTEGIEEDVKTISKLESEISDLSVEIQERVKDLKQEIKEKKELVKEKREAIIKKELNQLEEDDLLPDEVLEEVKKKIWKKNSSFTPH